MSLSMGLSATPNLELKLFPRFLSGVCGHRILYFHHVGTPDLKYYDGGIPVERFQSLLTSLKKAGFSFISIKEALASRASLRGTISLCSDDGFVSNFTTAIPVLKDLDIPLTLFLVGACIDNRSFAWNHLLALLRSHVPVPQLQAILPELENRFDLNRGMDLSSALFSVSNSQRDAMIDWLWERFDLPEPETVLREHQPFLSAPQLKALQGLGVDVALHSNSHADFSRLSYEELKEEILANIGAFESHNLTWQPWLAFPYGRECSMQNMLCLQKELGIQRFFGTRYCWQDNRFAGLLWQRSGIEAQSLKLWQELLLKPLYRSLVTANRPGLQAP